MAYTRKTRDIWDIQQYTGPQHGWETVACYESRTSARIDAKIYRQEQPQYPVRIKKLREPIALNS